MKLFLAGGPASPPVCVWALLLILAAPALAQQPDDILKLSKRMIDLQRAGKHAEALYHRLGQMDQAETILQRALAIREAALGSDHPAVAATLNYLGALYVASGETAKAEQLLRRALSIRERVLGPAHPAVATTLEHYAALLRSSGRQEEAARAESRARRIREEDQVRQAPRP